MLAVQICMLKLSFHIISNQEDFRLKCHRQQIDLQGLSVLYVSKVMLSHYILFWVYNIYIPQTILRFIFYHLIKFEIWVLYPISIWVLIQISMQQSCMWHLKKMFCCFLKWLWFIVIDRRFSFFYKTKKQTYMEDTPGLWLYCLLFWLVIDLTNKPEQ